MALSVIRSSRSLVRPHEETPSSTLDLSVIDSLSFMNNARTLYVFRYGGSEAAKVIREALSKVLVPYYPIAGRLKKTSESSQFQIECSGEGVWFVEASADCTLDAVNYFDNDGVSNTFEELFPDQTPRNEGVEPLVQMQVTQFACGGFVMGLNFSHRICDGIGASQFLNAIGEVARGLENPSISPVWKRDFISHPPQQATNDNSLPIQPTPWPSKLKYFSIDLSMDRINQMKREFHESTGQTCSTFEVIVARLWRCRTVAINLKENTEVKLSFAASCRKLLDPPLPDGFYGNCIFPITVTASSDSITQASIADVIKLIQKEKMNLPIEFGKYVRGEHLKNGEDPFALPLSYTTLAMSDWIRLAFEQIDYGWGPPTNVVSIQSFIVVPFGLVRSLPKPNKGIRLMTWCVDETHWQVFVDQMNESF